MFNMNQTRCYLKLVAMTMFWGITLIYLATSSHASQSIQQSTIYQKLASGEKMQPTYTDDYMTPEQPTVYITFDDGPSKHTEQILDILKKEHVPATFFVLGQASKQYPETIRRIVAEGHRLGNHTYDHRYENLYSHFGQYWSQVQQTDEILQEIAGVTTRLHRAPGGTHTNFDPFYFYYLDQAGYHIFDWNMDSGDSKRRGVPASEIVANVRNSQFTHEVHLLLHDSAGHGETAKALPEIINIFREKGYAFAALTDQVRPVVHSLGRNKWSRQVNLQDHAHMLAAVHVASQTKIEEKEEPEAAVPLQLKGGSETYVIDSESYFVERGHIHISLRAWSEERGLKLHWNKEEKTAYLQQPHQLSLWDPAQQEVRIRNAYPNYGQVATTPADVTIVDGRLFVPLRSLLDLERITIQGVTFTDEERLILIQTENWRDPLLMARAWPRSATIRQFSPYRYAFNPYPSYMV